MSGPKDMTTANTVIAKKNPIGDCAHRRAVALEAADAVSSTASPAAAIASERLRLVIVREGQRAENPSSRTAVMTTAAVTSSSSARSHHARRTVPGSPAAAAAGGPAI